MGREVSYRQQTLDTPNPIARFAHRQRARLSLHRVGRDAPDGATVLDYGCGDGAFLKALAGRRPDLTLLGYDPESDHLPDAYLSIEDTSGVPDRSVAVVCCFETLEHLYDAEIDTFVAEARRVAAPAGEVVISVPVIGGPPLLLKEANRALLFRRGSDYSARELLAASLTGRPASRPEDIRVTHKGFDFRPLLSRLSCDLRPLDTACSPFPRLPWWLNSQVFARFAVPD
jgi:SAM-dependent methyltransferase